MGVMGFSEVRKWKNLGFRGSEKEGFHGFWGFWGGGVGK